MSIIRVFPRRTSMMPGDSLAFVGDPPLWRPPADEVHVSCVFTWDKPEAERLRRSWSRFYPMVKVGGPAYDDPGGDFIPGRYVREGVTITSRGCPRRCGWCWVPKREGKIRTLPIQPGRIVQDNNLLACPRPHVEAVFRMLEGQRQIELPGGLDSLLLAGWHIDWFRRNQRRIGQLWFAADDQMGMRRLRSIADRLGFLARKKKRCYVLVGYLGETISKAEERLEGVWDLGFMPFAQFYRGPGERTKTLKWSALQKRWSRPAIMKARHRE